MAHKNTLSTEQQLVKLSHSESNLNQQTTVVPMEVDAQRVRGNVGQFGRRHSKSQSFEIVLKGCYFEPMNCRNYDRRSAVPKLQTTCCITVDTGDFANT